MNEAAERSYLLFLSVLLYRCDSYKNFRHALFWTVRIDQVSASFVMIQMDLSDVLVLDLGITKSHKL